MRSFKSGLFTFTIAGFVGMAAVIGCSADGSGDVIGDQSATEPADEGMGGNILPPSNPTDEEGTTTTDGGKKDSTAPKQDAAKDAGPPPPNEGDTCTQVDKIYVKACGKCGKQEAICLDDGNGKLTVSPYGQCLGETGVCVPGTTEQASCGNCGTLTKTCNQYCAWSSTTCGGQPANSCSPGTVEYTTAGCQTPFTYRNKTCGAACTWGGTSTTCEEPNNPIKVNIATTVSGTAIASVTLATTKMGKQQPTYGCGDPSDVSTTADYPYEVVEIKNTTAKVATISYGTTGTAPKVAYAVYPTILPPSTDNELAACSDADWSPYTVTGVTIPAGGRILMRIASYYASSSTTQTTTGTVNVTLTTTALN